MTDPMYNEIERVARDASRRLVAYLAVRTRDVAAAEEAMADAYNAALQHWPRIGVPQKPEAWLMSVARNRLNDVHRQQRVRDAADLQLLLLADETVDLADTQARFPDERLKLLFVCTHPVIDASMHTPLMLQCVLGLDAAHIASAFLYKPAVMNARLTRVKNKLRDDGIAFDVPSIPELPTRLDAVLDAIYAAYGRGWDEIEGADNAQQAFSREAIELATLLRDLLPREPEVCGLLALMLFCQSRSKTRRSAQGGYVPLSEQNHHLWDEAHIRRAEKCLVEATNANRLGRFQLEAAIHSVHVQRRHTGITDWNTITQLYEGLVNFAPSIGSLLGYAAASSHVRGAQRALDVIGELPAESVIGYQPYWALRAHLLQQLQYNDEASAAYDRAIGLCSDNAMREFLLQQQALLQ